VCLKSEGPTVFSASNEVLGVRRWCVGGCLGRIGRSKESSHHNTEQLKPRAPGRGKSAGKQSAYWPADNRMCVCVGSDKDQA